MLQAYILQHTVIFFHSLTWLTIKVQHKNLDFSVKAELMNALENEIKAEKKLEEESLGGPSPPSIPGFTIKTDGADVTLTKSFGNEK